MHSSKPPERPPSMTGGDRPAGPREIPVALSVAGSDSGRGGGIQADLKTFHAFRVFGTTAITAVTAQNTRGVTAATALPPELVRAQITAVFEDLRPAAVKTGMLADAAVAAAVADELRGRGAAPVVVDPVMVATSGDRLLARDAESVLRDALLPLAAVVTPNLPEAETLTGLRIESVEAMEEAARALVWFDGASLRIWRAPRADSRHTHGTGCTLSAAIAAGLALGRAPESAIETALAWTRRAIEAAPGLGSGRGPLNHWVPTA